MICFPSLYLGGPRRTLVPKVTLFQLKISMLINHCCTPSSSPPITSTLTDGLRSIAGRRPGR